MAVLAVLLMEPKASQSLPACDSCRALWSQLELLKYQALELG